MRGFHRALERLEVHIAAEGRVRDERVRPRQVHAARPRGLDVGARRVEQAVGQDGLAGQQRDGAQDALGGTPLVGGKHEGYPGQRARGVGEAVVAACACVRLVAAHHRGPLLGAHRARPRVGEEIDDDVVGAYAEQVVVRGLQDAVALARGRHPDGLDDLDAKRLDDGAGHGVSLRRGEEVWGPLTPSAGADSARRAQGLRVADPRSTSFSPVPWALARCSPLLPPRRDGHRSLPELISRSSSRLEHARGVRSDVSFHDREEPGPASALRVLTRPRQAPGLRASPASKPARLLCDTRGGTRVAPPLPWRYGGTSRLGGCGSARGWFRAEAARARGSCSSPARRVRKRFRLARARNALTSSRCRNGARRAES